MKLCKNVLHLLRDRQTQMGGVFQQGYALIGQVEADHCAAQSAAVAYDMKIDNMRDPYQKNNEYLLQMPLKPTLEDSFLSATAHIRPVT